MRARPLGYSTGNSSVTIAGARCSESWRCMADRTGWPPKTFPPMRPQVELQHAHDLLFAILSTPPVAKLIESEFHPALRMALDCLCWSLHHDGDDQHPSSHAANFAVMIKDLREWFDEVMEEAVKAGVAVRIGEEPRDEDYVVDVD